MALLRTRSFSLRRGPSAPRPLPVPPVLRRLEVRCPDRDAHQLALRLRAAGPTVTRLGYVAMNFVCPFRGCNHREVWGIDRTSGRPACLWAGKRR